ncbi:MAG: class I tRNA ligase family protein [Planctomycetes bacterium]|nr:class I tRNA ligase family protein [Planctomycetota bacterium]
MGEDGLKMSKSKKNYKEPTYIFDKEGSDAMRWLFFSGQTPWTSIRFQEAAIAEGQREFIIRLYNCYSFFVIYANIDKWTPSRSDSNRAAPSGSGRSRKCQPARPLDSQRTRQYLSARLRHHGSLRQLFRRPRAHRFRRRPLKLVRPTQPRPLLENRNGRRQARGL